MKKIIQLLAIFVLLASCNSQEKRTKKLINENMRTTLNDYKSYEPIEYGELEPTKTKFEQTADGKAIDLEILAHLQKNNEYLDMGINSVGMAKFYMDLAEKEMKIADNLSYKRDQKARAYKGEDCWSLTHIFRAKNAGGIYGIHNSTYYFDKEITKIIDQKIDW